MTINDTNSRIVKPIIASLLLCVMQLPTNVTAETQLRLQTLSDQLKISDGYPATVEQWSATNSAHLTNQHVIIIDDDDHYRQVWIDDVGTSLFSDYDQDGYFGGFSLSFDVDISQGDRDIYATIFLQLGQQSPVELHTTEVFTIYSRSGSDKYRVDAELVDNYQAGDYQVQIDIHDAYTGEVLDSVSQETHRNLRNLPLEAEPYNDTSHGPITSAVVVTEFVGFGGPVLLFILAFGAVMRQFKGRIGILGFNLAATRVTPDDTDYEQAPVTTSTINRLTL